TARFAEAVHDADPARPVPTCPEWTLAQLTEHVGQAQRWVTVVLERRAPVPNAQVQVRSRRTRTSGRPGWWPAPTASAGPSARWGRRRRSGPGRRTPRRDSGCAGPPTTRWSTGPTPSWRWAGR